MNAIDTWSLTRGAEITTSAGSKVAVAVMHDHEPTAILIQFTATGGGIKRLALRDEAAQALYKLLTQALTDTNAPEPTTVYLDAQDWPREPKQ